MNIKLLKAQSILQEALQEALFDLEDTRLKNIAVTRVECTRGREMAKVFLDENSLGDMGANDALKLLKKASGAIRANLQTQLSWYKMPNLVFEIDRTLNEINKLESIFKKIHSESSLRGVENAKAIHNNKIDCHDFATQNLAMTSNGVSSLRGESMDSPKQSKKNNLHEVQTESRPIRGAKNRIQGCSSATADFLLESGKRGSPPKSEKRQLLGTQFKHLGGAEADGAALLRKEISEPKNKKIVGDSQVAKIDCFGDESPRNDKVFLDCHDFATQNLAMTSKGDSSLRESRSDSKQSTNIHDLSPQDEFATNPKARNAND